MDFSKASGKINHNLLLAKLRGCSYEGELAQLGGIARLGEMILSHVLMVWNLLSWFNQKVCYVAGKRLFDQVIFTINSDVKPSCRTNVLISFI